jgi:hypothetical protein
MRTVPTLFFFDTCRAVYMPTITSSAPDELNSWSALFEKRTCENSSGQQKATMLTKCHRMLLALPENVPVTATTASIVATR